MIEQLCISNSVIFFKEKLLKKYNLKEYTNKNKPCIFNGLYNQQDYIKLIQHNSHKTVVWCGTDATMINKNFKNLLSRAGEIRHIAKSKFVSETLSKHGIKHILLPITPTIPIKNYKPKGENIYFYSGNNKKKYGGDFVDQIKKITKYKIIETNKNTYKSKELEKIYESCFLGLRLTKHDGLPNTVLEMGLMGRNCIHNGNTPNSIGYKTLDDIIEIIDSEYEKRNENSEKIVDDVYDFLNISDEWLKI